MSTKLLVLQMKFSAGVFKNSAVTASEHTLPKNSYVLRYDFSFAWFALVYADVGISLSSKFLSRRVG